MWPRDVTSGPVVLLFLPMACAQTHRPSTCLCLGLLSLRPAPQGLCRACVSLSRVGGDGPPPLCLLTVSLTSPHSQNTSPTQAVRLSLLPVVLDRSSTTVSSVSVSVSIDLQDRTAWLPPSHGIQQTSPLRGEGRHLASPQPLPFHEEQPAGTGSGRHAGEQQVHYGGF